MKRLVWPTVWFAAFLAGWLGGSLFRKTPEPPNLWTVRAYGHSGAFEWEEKHCRDVVVGYGIIQFTKENGERWAMSEPFTAFKE